MVGKSGRPGVANAIVVAAGGALGVFLVRALVRKPGASSSRFFFGESLPMASLTPHAGPPKTAGRIRDLAARFQKIWPDVVPSEPLTPRMLEVLLAQAGGAEFTSYGKGWDGVMSGSENVGAYQCSAFNQTGTSYYSCVARKDSMPMPDGTQKEFDTTFRFYKDGVTPDGKSRSAADAAAWDYLSSVTKVFPALAEIKSGSVLDYARRQGINGYFGGFSATVAEQKAYAPSIRFLLEKGGLEARAARVHASQEQIAGRIVKYAKAMGRVLPEIAAALGYERVHATLPRDLYDAPRMA